MLKKYKQSETAKSLFILSWFRFLAVWGLLTRGMGAESSENSKPVWFIGNKRGSLAGALVAFGLLGVSISGLITYVQHFSKTSSQTAEQINFNPQFLGTVLGNMKSLLIDAEKNAAGLSQNGICALVKPSTNKLKKGVEEVALDVTQLVGAPPALALRWTTFFSSAVGWTPAPTSALSAGGRCDEIAGSQVSFADSNLMKCFQYTGDSERSNEIYVVAQIIPKEFPGGASAIANNNLAARNAVFHLKASIGVIPFQDASGVTSKVAYINTRSDMLWANSAGNCVVNVNEHCNVDADCSQAGATCSVNVCSIQIPQVFKLSASGMMGSGDEGILNAELTNTQDSCAGIVIGDLKPYATQGGKLEAGSGSINQWAFKDDGAPIHMACVMKKFRCKDHTWNQTDTNTFFDDGMHFTFQLDNNTGRPIVIEKMNPVLRGAGTDDPPAIAVYSLAPDHPFAVIEATGTNDGKFELLTGAVRADYENHPLFQVEPAPSNRLTLRIPPGGGQFKVIFKGNTACSATNDYCAVYNVCDGVCQNNQNWYPEVTITANDPKLGTCSPNKAYSSNRDIECISCFAKSCHRLGMGTVGNRDDIPEEALDSQLPECRAAGASGSHDTERKIASTNTFKGSNTNAGSAPSSTPSDACIALKLDDADSDGDLDEMDGDFKTKVFEERPCATTYPVLCYANGRYQPATVWDATLNSGNGGYKLKEVAYSGAQEACYEMGKEVLDKNRLKQYIESASTTTGSFTNTHICSGTNCEFVNNATRGMFFLPTYDIGTVLNKDLLTSPMKTYIWVAAERDRGGLVVATPLKADLVSGGANDYALFNRKESSENYDPVLLKENAISTGGANDPYVLVYSVKYKGLIKRPKATSLHFVCQREGCTDPSQTTQATCTGTWDHDSNTATPAVDRLWEEDYFFLSSAAGTFCNGPSQCANDNGYFVAPESALDYSRAMLLLKNTAIMDETSDEYAIPVISSLGTATNHVYTQSVGNSVQAWVAINEVDTATGASMVSCP